MALEQLSTIWNKEPLNREKVKHALDTSLLNIASSQSLFYLETAAIWVHCTQLYITLS